MGVLNCSRYGCEKVMCDRFSYTYGYLCDDCFEELVNSNLDIEEFLTSSKKEKIDYNKRREELNEIFKPNNGEGYQKCTQYISTHFLARQNIWRYEPCLLPTMLKKYKQYMVVLLVLS